MPGARLPPSCTHLGGFDGTAAAFDERALKNSLFDFSLGSTPTLRECSVPTGDGESKTETYAVPQFLDMRWNPGSESRIVTGESKKSFTWSPCLPLFPAVHLPRTGPQPLVENAAALGAKVLPSRRTDRTWRTNYSRAGVYSLFLVDPSSAREHLLDQASRMLNDPDRDPKDIVDAFGTHFMIRATFGGLQIASATVDVRDEVSTTELKDAFKLSLQADPLPLDQMKSKFGLESDSATDGPLVGGKVEGGWEQATEQTKKIKKAMKRSDRKAIGGHENGDLWAWRRSLTRVPSKMRFKRRLAESSKIEDDGCEIIATFSPLEKIHSTWNGGNSFNNSTFARPRIPSGPWFALAQYGQNVEWARAFPEKNKPQGVVVRNVQRERGGQPAVKMCPRADCVWENRTSHTLWKLSGDGYKAFGDVMGKSGSGTLNARDEYAVIQNDLVKPIPDIDRTWLWSNSHGGYGVKWCTLMSIPTHNRNDQGDREIYSQTGGWKAAPFVGVESSWEDAKRERAEGGWTLDWTKVKWLEPTWLKDISL
ncbi:hypothetical protein MKZ38_009698 [Zalerion maritima]|uniref:MACPF domain-containing protein n=1 Tax=Zalerion maritima TaxID=339359 RepID=A0AAD5RFT7_9PEZI|nr:hypothetical protein MKZ38_009698 [Zalerion maritima]